MSATVEASGGTMAGAATGGEAIPAGRGALWRAQVAAIVRLEVRKSLFGRRAIPLYLLALAPVFLMLIRMVLPLPAAYLTSLGATTRTYAIFYQTFCLRMVVFFGCVWIFTNLFRGEVLDRSLHYYFLAPLERPVLVVGKYLAGLLVSVTLFGFMTVASFVLVYLPVGSRAATEFLVGGPGAAHFGAYLGVTVLACVGYGAVFLIIGLLFRNPIVPAGVILAWELLNFLMPPLLKKVSVIQYLKYLCPVPLSEGPFAVVAEPPPAWASILGLLLLTAVLVVLSCLRIRRLEISYGED
jgi:ABC-type transport system involved in multi-copper enzyme maturation permease subunit